MVSEWGWDRCCSARAGREMKPLMAYPGGGSHPVCTPGEQGGGAFVPLDLHTRQSGLGLGQHRTLPGRGWFGLHLEWVVAVLGQGYGLIKRL